MSLLIRSILIAGCLGVAGVISPLSAAQLSDLFETRETLTSTEGMVSGNNLTATRDPKEPSPGRLATGKTLWISWVAPANGLALVSTDGSSIPTLMRVYGMEHDEGPEDHEELESVIDSDDDTPSTGSSSAQFAARKGERYEILIDGYAGAAGDVQLKWKLTASDSLLPLVVRRSGDRSIQLGSPLLLTVDIQSTENLEMRWLHNDVPVPDGEKQTLVIRRFQPSDVGQYRLWFKVDDLNFKSAPIEIQVNSEGLSTVLARNRMQDSTECGVAHYRLPPPVPTLGLADVTDGFSRGYNGSQIFNTTFATRDPSEPLHCGVQGGASYWFAYQPPVEGKLTIDSEGSAFDTVVAIYSYDPPLLTYAGLVPVGCDDNSGSDGLTSHVEVDVDPSKSYLIVLDGVGGAKGLAHLNYHLTPTVALSPQPPVLIESPAPQVLAANGTLVLETSASGSPPLSYQWFMNGQPLSGQTNAAISIAGAQASDAGDYSIQVSNVVASVSSPSAHIQVISSPLVSLGPSAQNLVIGFPASLGFRYQVETTSRTDSNAWQVAYVALTDPGGVVWWTNRLDQGDTKFFRLRTQ